MTVPNLPAAAFEPQSYLSQADLDILAAAHAGTGVRSGCAVTAQGSPDMTVAVAAGVIVSSGFPATVAGGNVTITAAHSTYGRKDLVVASSSGVKSSIDGTAAPTPLLPDLPAGSVALAEVYVPATDTTINTNQITDKRVTLFAGVQATWKTADESVSSSAALQDDNHLQFVALANTTYVIDINLLLATGGGGIKVSLTALSGMTWFWGGMTTRPAGSAIANYSQTTSLEDSQNLGTSFMPIHGYVAVGGTGGTVHLTWAQQNSQAAASTLKQGSTMTARQV